jgi:hypothetical protein
MAVPRLARLLPPLAAAAILVAGVATSAASGAPTRPSSRPVPKPRAETGSGALLATDARRRRHRRRPGCGSFCRQAGGFGAGPGAGEGPVLIRSQRVRADRDWIIAVRAICRRDTACVGAILVDGRVSYGRADLRIGAHATRRVRVAVPAAGRRYLRRHRRDRRVFATVALKDNAPISISSRLTLLRPR